MQRLIEGAVGPHGRLQSILEAPSSQFCRRERVLRDPTKAYRWTSNRTLQAIAETPPPTLYSAVVKIISAWRATRERSDLEAALFRTTLRQMHCLHEAMTCGNDALLGRQISVAGSDEGSDTGDVGPSSDSQVLFHHDQSLSPVRLIEIISTLRHDRASTGVSNAEVFSILAMAHRELSKLPNVVHMQVPSDGRVIVVGDIHGQMDDLDIVLQAHGGPSSDTVFLFNGDFVDRGPNGVEVLITLLCYMLLDTNTVHLNRGNHEDHNCTARYGFMQESIHKYGQEFYCAASKVFLQLPLMYIVNDQVAVVHGGLPAFPDVTLDEINSINRKVAPKIGKRFGAVPRAEELYQALLWSDPRDFYDGTDSHESYRGVGCFFGEGLTHNFLKGNHLKMLVRSHEVCSAGYDRHHTDKVATVFSASNYCGTDDNQGCYLVIYPSLEVSYVQHSVIPGVGPTKLHDIGTARLANQERTVSAKDECLKLLRQAIFVQRQVLLHEFQQFDVKETGKVSVAQWVRVCQSCVHRDVRWYMLRKYLIMNEPDCKVAYLPFLERFQIGYIRSWMRRWATKLKPFIVHHLLAESKRHLNHLTYNELCEALRHKLLGLPEHSIYYLLVSLFPGGCIRLRKLGKMAREGPSEPPCILDVWVMFNFRKDAWREFLKDWAEECHVDAQQVRRLHPESVERELAPHLGRICRQRFIELGMRHCRQVGGIARKRWEQTSQLLDADEGGIEFQHIEAKVRDLGEEWSQASQVLELLTNITRACFSTQDLFAIMDDGGDGLVTQAEFSNVARHLLGRGVTTAQIKLLFKAFDLDNTGALSRQNIIDGLEVVDVWNAPLKHSQIIPPVWTQACSSSRSVSSILGSLSP